MQVHIFSRFRVAKNIYRSFVVIAVEVRSTAGAAGAAPTTGAVAGVWAWAGTNASCLPPAFPDAGPDNGWYMISIDNVKASMKVGGL